MWSKPWSYKEGLVIGAGLLVIGLLLQMTVGAINWQGERSITCTSYYSLYFFNPNDFISYFLVPSTRFPLSCHSQFDIALF